MNPSTTTAAYRERSPSRRGQAHKKGWLQAIAGGLLALASLSLTACTSSDEEEAPLRPNLLLISLDTVRADHLGSYGYERNTTPFLDQLAARGIRFDNAFINTLGTTPSHASILTGLYQESHRVEFHALDEDLPTSPIPSTIPLLQERLADAGYQTVAVTDGGRVHSRYGFARGFETYQDRELGAGKGTHELILDLARRVGAELPEGAPPGTYPEAPPPAPSSPIPPIFAFFHTYEVHSPYRAPQGYRGRFGTADSNFEPTSPRLLEVTNSAEEDLSDEDILHIRNRYDEGLRFTDDMVKGFFEKVGAFGFLDNTWVIITSDHGEEFGEHGGVLHRGLLYEELVRVPLIVIPPAGLSHLGGRVETQMVSSVDIVPTLLKLAGLPVPPQLPGRDLLDLPKVAESEDRSFSQFRSWRYSIRSDEWKLILNHHPKRRTELYNLKQDPLEQNNVFADNRRTARVLQEQLEEWIEQNALSAAQPEADIELDEEAIRNLEALGYVGN